MNRNFFVFLLVLAMICGIAISYLQKGPVYVLSVLLLVPVVSIFVSFILSLLVRAHLLRGNYSASLPNKATTFQVRLYNRAPVSVTRVDCILIASYLTS